MSYARERQSLPPLDAEGNPAPRGCAAGAPRA